MYVDTIATFVNLAERKVQAMRNAPLRFFVSSMLAGALLLVMLFVAGGAGGLVATPDALVTESTPSLARATASNAE